MIIILSKSNMTYHTYPEFSWKVSSDACVLTWFCRVSAKSCHLHQHQTLVQWLPEEGCPFSSQELGRHFICNSAKSLCQWKSVVCEYSRCQVSIWFWYKNLHIYIFSQVIQVCASANVTHSPVMGPGLVSTSPDRISNRCSRRKPMMTLPVMQKDSR